MLAYSTIGQLSYVVHGGGSMLKPLSEVGAHRCTWWRTRSARSRCSSPPAPSTWRRRRPSCTEHAWDRPAHALDDGGVHPWCALSMIGMCRQPAGFVSKWYILGGAIEDDNYLALAALVGSTLLNAAYFLPFIFAAFLYDEDVKPKKDHGEAPWPMVAALTLTALLTFAFFLFHQPIADLESQILQK
jgi:multicomponent Na+:H+ antiporter subunit D